MATNAINGKAYIGLTRHLETRKKEHRKRAGLGSSTHFHRAIRRYGWHNFVWVTMAKCSNVDLASYCERDTINHLDTYRNGYNMTTGGEGGWTKIVGKKTREKLAAIMRGKTYAELYGAEKAAKIKAKQSAFHSGKKVSAHTRALMSEANRRRWSEGRPIGKLGNPCEVFGVRYKTNKEAAEAINIARVTLRKWIRSGKNGARLV